MEISIICVYNNKEILDNFLKKGLSIQKNITYETIYIDNTSNIYKTAKEAFIEACKNVNGKYYMFVHQDILFENENTLKEMYDILEKNNNFGIAGVAGKKDKSFYSNIVHGQDRKRITENILENVEEVDTVDECLFVIRNDIYAKYDFTKLICSTWHLYAVEYSLIMKQENLKVITIPVYLYHASKGSSFNNTYYEQLKYLIKKYKIVKRINTTMGNWYTNRILLELQIIKGVARKWKNKILKKTVF